MRKLRKPDFADDLVSLWCGDALKILPRLPEPISHYLTDPPYEATMHRAKAKQRKIRTDGGKALKAAGFAAIGDLRPKLMPLVKAGCSGWFIAFCTPEGIAAWRDEIEAAGLRYKRACFWEKPDAAPQFNGQGPAYGVEPFVTAWCGRGVSRWNAGGRRNLWTVNTNNPEREGSHATEKPVELMMQLIEAFTKPGDLICDPFMGSGTTILAAAALGRRVIGIEQDAQSFKLARARYAAAFKMGRDEGRRFITQQMGRSDDPKMMPLFSGEMGQL